ncbi:MAG: carboxypeptidase regulatory-like domain-containing protein [Acidobacteria bacterium]|nr:carboxypeptidase regulatory-like domain-containing protein [Acidobacteriota bacterium]
MRRALIAPALLVAIGTGSAHAQVTTTGNIRIAVTDQDGLSVPGATVTAAAEDTATTRVAVTDIRGLAELGALQPSARYVLTVELQGFQTSRQEDFLVRDWDTS